MMQKITPFLWFNNQAEEAAEFYVSVFKNSKMIMTTRYTKESSKASGVPEGTVMTAEFEIEGQHFTALNGGPVFTFNESISFVVHCETQQEIDRYWDALNADPDGGQCGWLKDKYGVSWQIVPSAIARYSQSEKAMGALMQMKKIDIATLEKASRE